MDKKITIVELVNKYKKLTNAELQKKTVLAYVPENTYIPYAAKCYLADVIVNKAVLNNNVIKMDSAKRYSLYIFALVDNYTQIEVNANEWNLSEYDMLEESGVLDLIMSLLPEKEISSFTTVLNMKVDDAIVNNPSKKDILIAMMKLATPDMNDIFENIDEEQFGKILEFVNKKENN